jgi:hypothetical protein
MEKGFKNWGLGKTSPRVYCQAYTKGGHSMDAGEEKDSSSLGTLGSFEGLGARKTLGVVPWREPSRGLSGLDCLRREPFQ